MNTPCICCGIAVNWKDPKLCYGCANAGKSQYDEKYND